MKQNFAIAVIPGDGVGGEVTAAALKVLDSVLSDGVLEVTHFPWSSAYYGKTGAMMDADGVSRLRNFDAILFGASGWPEVPDHVSLWGLRLAICQGLDQYVSYRPSRCLAGVQSPLASKTPFDFVIVRENTGGEYAGCGGRVHGGTAMETATQTAVFTRGAIERVVDYAFALARTRSRHLTSITKSNAQQFAMVLWDEVIRDRAAANPDIEVDELLVDAAAARLILAPQDFDVIVASNLFGDILSDIGGALVGSLGLAASGNLDPSGRNPSMFEPVHGSAPDIVGKGIANPVGAISSAAMMLDTLGMRDAATAMSQATESALAAGVGTPDIGGTCSTEEVTAEIIGRISNSTREGRERFPRT